MCAPIKITMQLFKQSIQVRADDSRNHGSNFLYFAVYVQCMSSSQFKIKALGEIHKDGQHCTGCYPLERGVLNVTVLLATPLLRSEAWFQGSCFMDLTSFVFNLT